MWAALRHPKYGVLEAGASPVPLPLKTQAAATSLLSKKSSSGVFARRRDGSANSGAQQADIYGDLVSLA